MAEQLELFGENEVLKKGAFIDPTGNYRYNLWRVWDKYKPRVTFIMLNPSTADANLDDPTIRRCIGFAKFWGYGTLEVVNLFAFRATNPKDLLKVKDYGLWCLDKTKDGHPKHPLYVRRDQKPIKY